MAPLRRLIVYLDCHPDAENLTRLQVEALNACVVRCSELIGSGAMEVVAVDGAEARRRAAELLDRARRRARSDLLRVGIGASSVERLVSIVIACVV